MIPAMVLIAAGMGFGIVGLQYVAVTGVTEDDAGIASGVQRAADQLGGSTGVTLYVGIGFAPALDGTDPFLTSSLLAVAGLAAAGCVAWRISCPPRCRRKRSGDLGQGCARPAARPGAALETTGPRSPPAKQKVMCPSCLPPSPPLCGSSSTR